MQDFGQVMCVMQRYFCLTQIDPHSLGKWRVDGALPHIDAWYEAFNIESNDPMYLPKDERALFGK